jgi:cytochrome c oxidase assembly factor CtaG
MWMPIAGPLPKPSWFGGGAQVGYVVVARLASAGLGNILMWSGSVLYVEYASGQDYWNISAVADQGTAGVIMMVEGGLITLGALAWAILRWAAQDTEKQRLLELAEERGVALTPERAERAVSAGHGARLEERITGAKAKHT